MELLLPAIMALIGLTATVGAVAMTLRIGERLADAWLPAPAIHPFCPQCRHDLRGVSGNRCPECGVAFDEGTVIYRPPRSASVRRAVELIGMTLFTSLPAPSGAAAILIVTFAANQSLGAGGALLIWIGLQALWGAGVLAHGIMVIWLTRYIEPDDRMETWGPWLGAAVPIHIGSAFAQLVLAILIVAV